MPNSEKMEGAIRMHEHVVWHTDSCPMFIKIACYKIIKVLEPITMYRLVWLFDGPFVILA